MRMDLSVVVSEVLDEVILVQQTSPMGTSPSAQLVINTRFMQLLLQMMTKTKIMTG